MDTKPNHAQSDIAASFDRRAPSYNKSDWHRRCAEQLTEFCGIASGQVVLDAGTGTGLAAIAAAPHAGVLGRIVAVDLSIGMLRVARQHTAAPGEASIEWVEGDAVYLPGYPAATFDAVLCAAALLYMPVAAALTEWHRLLKPGGVVAFSSMKAGSLVAGRIFRECAARFGCDLVDPSEALGSEAACHAALRNAGFTATAVTGAVIPFTAQDIAMSWESNLGSAAHTAVRSLGGDVLTQMKASFELALSREQQGRHGSTSSAELLFAKGVRY